MLLAERNRYDLFRGGSSMEKNRNIDRRISILSNGITYTRYTYSTANPQIHSGLIQPPYPWPYSAFEILYHLPSLHLASKIGEFW